MLKKILRPLLFLLVILIGVVIYLAWPDKAQLPVEKVMGPKPEITDPRNQTLPTISIAGIEGWKEGEKPVAAKGLKVEEFAGGLVHPRSGLLLPNGDILITETGKPKSNGGGIQQWVQKKLMARAGSPDDHENRITLLRDTNKDSKADTRMVIADGLNSPFGMAWNNDLLFVANTDALMAFPYKLGDATVGAGTKIAALPANLPNNHWTRSLLMSEDGTKLYIGVGSDSNIGENGLDAEQNRASILEYDREKKRLRVYANGLRNPIGMDWDPMNKQLWVVVNERDMMGSDLPPDYLTSVRLGNDYGWPHFYWGGYIDRRVKPLRLDKQSYMMRPDYALGPHTASTGLAFARDERLGASFAKGAFVAQHGSWNRSPQAGFKVIFIPYTDMGYPTGALPVDVLTGFLNDDGDARGRPTSVLLDGNGGLLVIDDAGDKVWRVTAG